MTTNLLPLKVYKASAGSGKTFTLAVEYIRLLMLNPTNYRHILAVTFTNKATTEMKMRILSQLYGIGHGLADSEGYLRAIKEDESVGRLGLDDDTLRERARASLSLMMHDYSRFRVETIDSFFQSIMRELARELNLSANMRVDLNDKEVLHEAVKELIDDLQEGSDLFRSVFDFVKERIDDGKNWQIAQSVEDFGQNIFNEQYLQSDASVRRKIGDAHRLREYKQMLWERRKEAQNGLKAQGEAFLHFCDSHGYDMADFKYKSAGIYGFFQKLANDQVPEVGKRVQACATEAEAWCDKTADTLLADVEATLLPLLEQTLRMMDEATRTINTVNVINHHINHLMLIGEINDKVRSLNADANRFLLADTAHFLREVIDGSDIPFLFERTGTQFHYIMIDEFQDTSALQWDNFRPLLHNSLSAGNKCLIVGDVKQSIYRWRNSDWGILNNIEGSEFGRYIDPATVSSLDTNYRSAAHVVEFNNTLFSKATDVLNALYAEHCGQTSPDIAQAYSQVCQKTGKGNSPGGWIHLEWEKDTDADGNKRETGDEKFHLERLVALIDRLLGEGVAMNDITILVRFNKQGSAISQYIAAQRPDLTVVSDEAFLLDFSAAVQLLVLAMRAVDAPNDRYTDTMLAYFYQTQVRGNEQVKSDPNQLFLLPHDKLLRLLPADFTANREGLALLPLYEMAERLYDLLEISRLEGQDAYLFAFFDQLATYLDNKPAHLNSFLHYWDETMHKVSIPGGSIDGIRILTIHKSKGLEFHTVIVPFCNWNIGFGRNNQDLLWCQPQEAPYDQMPLLPITVGKEAEASIFKPDYDNELLKNYVDNLNLVYVAFTRARENLAVLCQQNKNGVDQLLIKSLPEDVPASEEDELTVWEQGTILPSQVEEERQTENVLLTPARNLPTRFVYKETTAEFLQSNQSRIFIQQEDNDETTATATQFVDEGNLFHELLARIWKPDDIDRAIAGMDTEGCFSSREQMHSISQLARTSLKDPRVRQWFDPHWLVLNECSILTRDDQGNIMERRPDRVISDGQQTIVIDYKTGRQNEAHAKQVEQYVDLLQRMGYPQVTGYLWYVRRKDIVEVNHNKEP